jgi:hypothetical protein
VYRFQRLVSDCRWQPLRATDTDGCIQPLSVALQTFLRIYNEERPHSALNNKTPIEHYAPSPRRWDGVLREPEYHCDAEIRRVRHNGEIKWQGKLIYISTALIGEPIGLMEDASGDWTAFSGPVALGLIAHRGDRLRKPKKHSCGYVDNATALPTSPQLQQKSAATRELNKP